MQPPLPLDKAEAAVAAVQAALDAGYRLGATPSAVQEGARRLGIPPQTMQSRIRLARREYGLAPVEREHLTPEPPIVESIAKPRVRIKMRTSIDDAPIYRVLGIGDAHDGPNLPDKSRFKWLARHAAATRPDYIVQIGDMFSFDSLNRFDRPGSLPQKIRPSFMADLESGEEALTAFFKECPPDIEKHICLGNHDVRPLKYQSGDASLEGALWPQVTDLLARYNWRAHDEGEFYFIGSVGFVHAPRTLMNREYGGKTLNSQANDAMFSFVAGHSHRGQVLHAPKIGPPPFSGVTLLNLGTCLPTGYVAEYAKVATHSWTYGCWSITIQSGRITGHQFISMDELEEKYGD